MKSTAISLWHLRNARVQEARAVLKEQSGDVGAASQARANARMHMFMSESLSSPGVADLLETQEYVLSELQREFHAWAICCTKGRFVTHCAINDMQYPNIMKLLSYSRATVIAHPGFDDIALTLWFDSGEQETHKVSEEFLQRRAQILF